MNCCCLAGEINNGMDPYYDFAVRESDRKSV